MSQGFLYFALTLLFEQWAKVGNNSSYTLSQSFLLGVTLKRRYLDITIAVGSPFESKLITHYNCCLGPFDSIVFAHCSCCCCWRLWKQVPPSFVWVSPFIHCLAALDFGAGVEQPFGCLIVQNRQAVQSVGKLMDWTLEDDRFDSLLFCATLTSRRGGHTPYVETGAETLPVGWLFFTLLAVETYNLS